MGAPDQNDPIRTSAMSVATTHATSANSPAHGVPNRMTAGSVPPEVETFLQDVADSFIKIELIKFFHRNHRLLGTVEDIAVAIGRDKRSTARAVPHLVSAGVLTTDGSGGAVIWSYDPDPQMTQRIDAFLAYYKTETGRMAVVRRVLEGEV